MKTYEIPLTFTINAENDDQACEKLYDMLDIKTDKDVNNEYIEVMQSMVNAGVKEVKYRPYEFIDNKWTFIAQGK